MSAVRLVIAPNWRPQVADIVQTMRDGQDQHQTACQLKFSSFARGLARISAGMTHGLGVLLCEDAHPRMLEWAARVGHFPHELRLWWNTYDDIAKYIARTTSGRETHIQFFEDAGTPLDTPPGISLLSIPYAFTSPAKRRPSSVKQGISYAAGVDTSDNCFEGILSPSATRNASDRAWELADAVVAGEVTLVAADQLLRWEFAGREPLAADRVVLWAVRNRVRYLLVKGLVAAFPQQVKLRGSDWATLGFDAAPSRYGRRELLSQYSDHRVALDLGSKSTHGWLYPRTADILASGGGLVQFDSGQAAPDLLPGLERRRAQALPDLVAAVDRMLSLPEADLARENDALSDAYGKLRLRVGQQLCIAIASRLS